jgi:hypothetical protein
LPEIGQAKVCGQLFNRRAAKNTRMSRNLRPAQFVGEPPTSEAGLRQTDKNVGAQDALNFFLADVRDGLGPTLPFTC